MSELRIIGAVSIDLNGVSDETAFTQLDQETQTNVLFYYL